MGRQPTLVKEEMMRVMILSLLVLTLSAGLARTIDIGAALQAQGNDPNILMLDNCDPSDPGYDPVGGCPQGGPRPQYDGDVSVDEFFELLFSPLAPGGQVIGHPSWRNEPSYITVRSGQTVRVTNRGGRVHTFTHVADFGGGFIGDLNGAMTPASECNPATVTFVPVGATQQLSGLDSGLQKFQCCIHPWMRAAIRVD
jgi:plastocyanin